MINAIMRLLMPRCDRNAHVVACKDKNDTVASVDSVSECEHKWITVRVYKNIINPFYGGLWIHDERGIEHYEKNPVFMPSPACAAVCIHCGECGGTIVEATSYIEKRWAEEEQYEKDKELAMKIYAEKCIGGVK